MERARQDTSRQAGRRWAEVRYPGKRERERETGDLERETGGDLEREMGDLERETGNLERETGDLERDGRPGERERERDGMCIFYYTICICSVSF